MSDLRIVVGEYVVGGNNIPTHKGDLNTGLNQRITSDMKIELNEPTGFYLSYNLDDLMRDVKKNYPNMTVYLKAYGKTYSIDEFCNENPDKLMVVLYIFDKFKYYDGTVDVIKRPDYLKLNLPDRYSVATSRYTYVAYDNVLTNASSLEREEFGKQLFADDVFQTCVTKNYRTLADIMNTTNNKLNAYIRKKNTEYFSGVLKDEDDAKSASIEVDAAFDLIKDGFVFKNKTVDNANKIRVFTEFRRYYYKRQALNNIEFDGDCTDSIKFLIDLQVKRTTQDPYYLKSDLLVDLVSLQQEGRLTFNVDEVLKYLMKAYKNSEGQTIFVSVIRTYLTRIPYEKKYNKLYIKLFDFDTEKYKNATALGKSLYFTAKVINSDNRGIQLKNFVHFYLGCLAGMTKQDFECDYDIFIEILGLVMNNDLKVFYSLLLGDTQIEYMIPSYMEARIIDGLFEVILPQMKKVRIRAILNKIYSTSSSKVFSPSVLESKLKEHAKKDIRYKQIMMEIKMKK